MNIYAAINHFLSYLKQEKHVSPYTLRNYRQYLRRFASYCDQLSPSPEWVSDITVEHIQAYVKYLDEYADENGISLQRKTKAYHIIALRMFLLYLSQNAYVSIPYTILDVPKISQPKPVMLDRIQLLRLLHAASVSSIQGMRDRVIISLLGFAGLTVSELVGLNRDNIDIVARRVVIQRANGKKRIVILSDVVLEFIQQYLANRDDFYHPLLLRYAGKAFDPDQPAESHRLSVRSVQRIIEKYSKQLGLSSNITPHSLRHSFAKQLAKDGIELDDLQIILGHKTSLSSKKYLTFSI